MKKVSILVILFSGICFPLMGFDNSLGIIPRPREVTRRDGYLVLETLPHMVEMFDEQEKPLVKATHELESSLERRAGNKTEKRVEVFLVDISYIPWDETGIEREINLASHEEAYNLLIEDNKIVIAGRTGQGLFYGLQTLFQLLHFQDDHIKIPLIMIEDHPVLDFRGIHFRRRIADEKALEEQKRLIDFMARHKMNYAVLQTDFLQFEGLPEMYYEPQAQCPEKIKKLVDYARERYIEIIPLVPSYGHAEWAFRSGYYEDLAEDPDNPYAFRVNYDPTYEVLFTIYDEVMEIFDSSWFHIGFDEVDLPAFGRYPYREETKEYTMEELIDIHLSKIAQYLGKQGVEKILLWGDMFLSREESPFSSTAAASAPSVEIAEQRRAILTDQHIHEDTPNLTICDWHYQPAFPENFTSLEVWEREGLPVIASTWHNPVNIANFSRKAVEKGVLGHMQTTWAGFDFHVEADIDRHHQFEAYLLAVDYAWSGRTESAEELPYNFSRVFWERWDDYYRELNGKIPVDALVDEEKIKLFQRNLETDVELIIPDDGSSSKTDLIYRCRFSLFNPFEKQLKVIVQGDLLPEEKIQYTLAPGERLPSRKMFFELPVEQVTPARSLELDFQFILNNEDIGNITRNKDLPLRWKAVALEKAPEIDGDLSQWKDLYPSYCLEDEGFIDQKETWCPEDLSARKYVGYYEGALYFAFQVRDDVHYNSYEPSQLWQGDAVQLAFDLGYDRTPYYDVRDLEIGIALDNEGETMKHSWFPEMEEDEGFMRNIEAEVRREEPYTYYEVKLPLDVLPETGADERGRIGYTFTINDNDGDGFEGGIIGSHGIWSTKDPSRFGILLWEGQ